MLGNIVCLCPNHHAACDLGAIEVIADELRPAVGHFVEPSYIDYHNTVVYRGNNSDERDDAREWPTVSESDE
jgi:hypothetical protein